jgi:hypothetical protein
VTKTIIVLIKCLLYVFKLKFFQGISGTGALRVGAAFLQKWFPGNKEGIAPISLARVENMCTVPTTFLSWENKVFIL